MLNIFGMGVKRHRLDQERVHWLLEAWIVQAALDQFGERRLSPDEQREVWKVTRSPDKVVWPEWWSERG